MTPQELLKKAGCEMKVTCGKEWKEFVDTDEEGIRFCGECKKLVFYTKTVAELRIAADKGLCVYIVPNSLADIDGDRPKWIRERIKEINAKALKKIEGPTTGQVIRR